MQQALQQQQKWATEWGVFNEVVFIWFCRVKLF